MYNSNYKDENFERKCINIMRKNQFLKVKNSLLELKIFFFELKDRKLKNREVKIKWKIQELFLKPIIVSADEMDKYERKKWDQLKTLGMIG